MRTKGAFVLGGVVLVASLAILTADAAQHSEAATDTPRFRSGVDVVALDVCVRDRLGRPVNGLTAADFLVLDNGVPQQLTLFVSGPRLPLAVTLVIDRSSSMSGLKLDRVREAALAFLDVLQPDDLVEVLMFNERVDRRVAFGADRAAAAAAVTDISAVGQTGLWEALVVALRDFQRDARINTSAEYRRAIVLVTDGDDSSSRITFEDVLEDVRHDGVVVYAVSLRADEHDRALPPSWQLATLATDTGGVAFSAQDPPVLASVLGAIAGELRQLYRVAYVPNALPRDGAWRPVSVRLASPDLRARTRAGYYAPRPTMWRGSQP